MSYVKKMGARANFLVILMTIEVCMYKCKHVTLHLNISILNNVALLQYHRNK